MIIALIADIHSNLEAFEAVLDHMGRVDQIWSVGDLVGYGAKPNEVVSLAKRLVVMSVMGNHDQAAVTNNTWRLNPYAARAIHLTHRMLKREILSFLKRLPLFLRLTVKNMKFHLVHGSPSDPLNEYVHPEVARRTSESLLKEANADVLIMGHTHVPMSLHINGKLILNPGGVGQPRDRDPRASYMLLEVEEGHVSFTHHRVEYDIDKAAREIIRAGFPRYLADRLYYGS